MARDRQWFIDANDYESEEAFRDAVATELARLENMGYREGGAFVATPIRMEGESPFQVNGQPVREFLTRGWLFSHTFMPAARRPEMEPVVEPELEPVGDA
jgi:hypothetical protein